MIPYHNMSVFQSHFLFLSVKISKKRRLASGCLSQMNTGLNLCTTTMTTSVVSQPPLTQPDKTIKTLQ